MAFRVHPNIGDILLHKDGKYYRVLMYCKHSDTEDTMIVYQSLESEGVWVQSARMFNSDRVRIVITADQLESQE